MKTRNGTDDNARVASSEEESLNLPETDSPADEAAGAEDDDKKRRRRFTAAYKLRILTEADACAASGEIGLLLKREGLYFSNLTLWRKQLAEGLLNGLTPKKRGRKSKKANPLAVKIAKLEKEKSQLEAKLKQAETIIAVQKKFFKEVGNIPVPRRRRHLMKEAEELGRATGTKAACSALGIPRASFYRYLNKQTKDE
jgi:transposase-like protein